MDTGNDGGDEKLNFPSGPGLQASWVVLDGDAEDAKSERSDASSMLGVGASLSRPCSRNSVGSEWRDQIVDGLKAAGNVSDLLQAELKLAGSLSDFALWEGTSRIGTVAAQAAQARREWQVEQRGEVHSGATQDVSSPQPKSLRHNEDAGRESPVSLQSSECSVMTASGLALLQSRGDFASSQHNLKLELDQTDELKYSGRTAPMLGSLPIPAQAWRNESDVAEDSYEAGRKGSASPFMNNLENDVENDVYSDCTSHDIITGTSQEKQRQRRELRARRADSKARAKATLDAHEHVLPRVRVVPQAQRNDASENFDRDDRYWEYKKESLLAIAVSHLGVFLVGVAVGMGSFVGTCPDESAAAARVSQEQQSF